MAEETLRYDKMVEDALRGVVREALAVTARDGLFGEHHFYITFRTHCPGVQMADHILARHPDEMTIVLQHQFWDLVVDDTSFRVSLSFSGKSETLIIPFVAITGFADPSAKFGLQFQALDDEDEGEDEGEGDEAEMVTEPIVAEPTAAEPAADEPSAPVEGGGNVVALDAFRKK